MSNRWKRCVPLLVGTAGYSWMVMFFFKSWRNPLSAAGGQGIAMCVSLLFLESILVVSGAIYSLLTDPSATIVLNDQVLNAEAKRRFQRGKGPWLITCVFIFIGLLFAAAFQMLSTSMLQIVALVMFSRVIGFFVDSEQARREQRIRFVVSACLYTAIVSIAIAVQFPAGGITPAVLEQVHFHYAAVHHSEKDLWAGMIYFGSLGLLEIILFVLPERKEEELAGADETMSAASDSTVKTKSASQVTGA